MGVAVNKKGDLYIADTYNHRVQLWEKGSTEGNTLNSGKEFKYGFETSYLSCISLVNESHL